VLLAHQSYSAMLTEQYLTALLTDKGATEEDILKYKFTMKQLKKKSVTETDFKLVVDKLVDSYVSRTLIDGMLQTQENLQQNKNGIEAYNLLERSMLLLKSQIASKDIRETSTRNMMDEVRAYEDMKAHPEKYRGIKIGVDKLDEVTGGFRKGELVITLGATKVGKSIFLLNIQYNTLINGYNSLFITIEMSLEQCRRRLASLVTDLHYLKIKNGNLTDEELQKMKDKLEAFEKQDAQSLIVDVPESCTPKIVEAKIRSMMKTQKIDLVILDYLLLMSPSMPSSKMNREERVTQIALELKQIARSLNIPIITASQVTADAGKKREKTSDEAYDWVDAGQAKSIVSHADWVLSLKREPDTNILNLGITAGRDGALENVIPLVCDYSKMKIGNFVDVTEENKASQTQVDSQVQQTDTF
ncbi:MAG: DnaB-like helicase C-terminal domain-containing protein, partial [Chitinophagaceae bacterium]